MNTKKIISLLLTCVTVLSMSVVSFAQEKDTNDVTSTDVFVPYDAVERPFHFETEFKDWTGKVAFVTRTKGTVVTSRTFSTATFVNPVIEIVENNTGEELTISDPELFCNGGSTAECTFRIRSKSGTFDTKLTVKGTSWGTISSSNTRPY